MSEPTPSSGSLGNRDSEIENRKLLTEPVVFFGTGPVAAESLTLLAEWANIEAVVTKPKPSHHKGVFPVLDTAQKLGLPVLTVSNRRELNELVAGRPVTARLGVLIDFGIIVSQAVIDYFELGIVNSHFSLLPEWRGADPITFSILSGQEQTGVSLMLLVEKMDEGPLLGQGVYDIDPVETTPSLTGHLIDLSDSLLQAALPEYLSGNIVARPQEELAGTLDKVSAEPSYSRKLTKDDGLLDFAQKPAAQLEREVRAYADWPKSRTKIGDTEVIVTKAHVLEDGRWKMEDDKPKAGTLYRNGKELGFYTIDDIFVIDRLKPAGKQEMTTEAFLNGYTIETD